ncbi:MAG: PKD domain-containing protein, partial [Firmicutes bacterium]|nr:PKD domain-containing protein [Bacillota bacterium]
MKKIILSVLMLGVMLSIVSAVSFINPTGEGEEYFSGDLVVDWDNPTSITFLTLQYKEDVCEGDEGWEDLTTIYGSTPTAYTWDTTEVSDGDYCLRIRLGDSNLKTLENVFTIDNTPPTADFTYDGILIVGEEIEFDGSASEDNEEGSGIETFAWDFGDDTTDDESGDYVEHTYAEEGTYEVVLTVTDYAGNQDTTTETIEIAQIVAEETFSFEAGILGIKDLVVDADSFDTGMEEVTCEFVNSDITDEMNLFVDSDGNGNCTLDWSGIFYEDRGVQNFVVKATGESDIKYFDVEITVYTWMIDLEQGWNLISIPMMPEDTSIDSVLGDIIENVAYEGSTTYTIFNYNAVNGKWYRARKYDDSSGYSGPTSYKLTTIVPGYGYWINMEHADTLKGIGSIAPERDGAMLGVEIANGWNLIGHYGLDELGYDEALTSLTLGSVGDGETTYYDAVVSDEDEMMYPYKGYWMTAKFLPNEVTLYTPAQEAI